MNGWAVIVQGVVVQQSRWVRDALHGAEDGDDDDAKEAAPVSREQAVRELLATLEKRADGQSVNRRCGFFASAQEILERIHRTMEPDCALLGPGAVFRRSAALQAVIELLLALAHRAALTGGSGFSKARVDWQSLTKWEHAVALKLLRLA